MLNFKDCTLAILEDTFRIEQTAMLPALDAWLRHPADISELDRQMVAVFQHQLQYSGYDWNETELAYNFIGPVMALVGFASKQCNFFAERPLSGTVAGVEMSGKPDGMIASGFREPKTPFFCIQEYKKQKDPEGDPAGQALAAMLVAQELNARQHPVYGAYIIGADWYFMALQGQQYAISLAYVATRDDVFEIFRILKALKQMIAQWVNEAQPGVQEAHERMVIGNIIAR